MALIVGVGVAIGAFTTSWLRHGYGYGPSDIPEKSLVNGVATTRTILPDGRTLVIGDEAGGKAMPAAEILDADHSSHEQSISLNAPRHFHTATAMPDGRILVWGGVDVRGKLTSKGEWFDPLSHAFSFAGDVRLAPRAGHTATVLTDGRLLIAGGWTPTDGFLQSAELFDVRSGKVEQVKVPAGVGRTATLLPDGRVAFQGGFDANGKQLAGGVIFDPRDNRTLELPLSRLLADMQPLPAAGTHIVETIPGPDVKTAAVNQPLVLRFSGPMDPTTLNNKTLTLLGPQGPIDVKINPAEDGRLAFVVPTAELLPDASYTLYVNYPRSRTGEKVPLNAIGFHTASLLASDINNGAIASGGNRISLPPLTALTSTGLVPSTAARVAPVGSTTNPKALRNTGYVEDGVWYPGKDAENGHWRVNRPSLPLPTVDMLHQSLPEHATGLFGQILQIDDKPVAGVEVSIGAVSTHTDSQGLFLLVNPPAGRQELYVDGTAAGRGTFEYGQILMGVDVRQGQISGLTQQVFLPKIRPEDRVAIDSPTAHEVVVTHPELPGLEIHIPAGSVIRDHKGRIVREMTLVPTPLDRAPYPVPTNFPVYFTLQPGGAVVLGMTAHAAEGMRVIYPNYTHAAPRTQSDFWVYDPRVGWKIYGKGEVGKNGQKVLPDPGVTLYAEMGAGFNTVQAKGVPAPASCPDGSAPGAADPCDLVTGRYDGVWTDFFIEDVIPIELTRRYHQHDMTVGDVSADPSYDYNTLKFGVGMSFNYGIQIAGYACDQHNTLNLILPNGVSIPFYRTSGSDTLGSWKVTSGVSRFYGATLASVGTTPESYIVTLTDGTEYGFGSEPPNILTSIRDRFGNTLNFYYSNVGARQISRIVSPSGRYLSFSYNAQGFVSQVSDHTGRTANYVYNEAGTLQSVTYADGTSMQYTYDPATNDMITVQDRRGNVVTTNQYDSNGRVFRQTLADGASYQVSYVFPQPPPPPPPPGGGGGGGAGGGGGGGNELPPPVCPVADQGTAGTNYALALNTTVTNPLGIVRKLTFNGNGYPLTDAYGYGQADAQTYSYTRNPSTDYPTQTTDPLGRVTQYSYDQFGNTTGVTLLAGTASAVSYAYTYAADSQIASATDPLGHTTNWSYTDGCLTGTQDALGHATSITCNGSGQPVSVTDPLGHTTHFGYNGYDLASITDPLSRTTSFNRDDLGRIVSLIDPLGNTVLRTYDSNDRVISSTNSLGFTTQYSYDNDGNLTSVMDPANGTTSYSYDSRNRRTGEVDALLHSQSWTYDGLGRPLTFTDRNGQQTTAAYDGLGRPATITDAAGGTIQYAYDAASRPISITDSIAGAISLSYDALDRLAQVQNPLGSIAYTYDTAGRRTSMQVAGQPAVTYAYDAANRLTALGNGSESVSYTYDAANRRTSLTLPNGITAQYGYDDADQLTALNYLTAGNAVLGSLAYQYDAAGRRTGTTGSWASDQLPGATAGDYTYNAGNRLTGGNTYSPAYDNEGQMTQDGQGRTYVWNARHQLSQIRQGATTVASFQYDALGRRIQKNVNGSATGYLYDGANPVQEQQGGTLNTLLTGPGIDERYARDDTPGRLFYLTDALGSTIALTDAGGNIQQRYAYDPYGGYAASNAGSTNNPYTYTGREDDQTGLYYYRARYYSPQMMRFISEDPLGLGGGLNVYAYVAGNPINFVDPFGLDPCNPRDRDFGSTRDRCSDLPRPVSPYVPAPGEWFPPLRFEDLPKTSDCKMSEWAVCEAKCPGRVQGCYVTRSWKLKGLRGNNPIRLEQRTVNCNCGEEPQACSAQ